MLMRALLPSVLAFALGGTITVPAPAQDARVDVSITVVIPAPTCAWTPSTDLAFGSISRPTQPGTEASVTIDAVDGSVSDSPSGASFGTQSAGALMITATNVATMTVDVDFPQEDSLTSSGGLDVHYNGTWAKSDDGTSYTLISTGQDTASPGGEGTVLQRRYRFGGTVDGIRNSTAPATYEGVVTVTATCI